MSEKRSKSSQPSSPRQRNVETHESGKNRRACTSKVVQTLTKKTISPVSKIISRNLSPVAAQKARQVERKDLPAEEKPKKSWSSKIPICKRRYGPNPLVVQSQRYVNKPSRFTDPKNNRHNIRKTDDTEDSQKRKLPSSSSEANATENNVQPLSALTVSPTTQNVALLSKKVSTMHSVSGLFGHKYEDSKTGTKTKNTTIITTSSRDIKVIDENPTSRRPASNILRFQKDFRENLIDLPKASNMSEIDIATLDDCLKKDPKTIAANTLPTDEVQKTTEEKINTIENISPPKSQVYASNCNTQPTDLDISNENGQKLSFFDNVGKGDCATESSKVVTLSADRIKELHTCNRKTNYVQEFTVAPCRLLSIKIKPIENESYTEVITGSDGLSEVRHVRNRKTTAKNIESFKGIEDVEENLLVLTMKNKRPFKPTSVIKNPEKTSTQNAENSFEHSNTVNKFTNTYSNEKSDCSSKRSVQFKDNAIASTSFSSSKSISRFPEKRERFESKPRTSRICELSTTAGRMGLLSTPISIEVSTSKVLIDISPSKKSTNTNSNRYRPSSFQRSARVQDRINSANTTSGRHSISNEIKNVDIRETKRDASTQCTSDEHSSFGNESYQEVAFPSSDQMQRASSTYQSYVSCRDSLKDLSDDETYARRVLSYDSHITNRIRCKRTKRTHAVSEPLPDLDKSVLSEEVTIPNYISSFASKQVEDIFNSTLKDAKRDPPTKYIKEDKIPSASNKASCEQENAVRLPLESQRTKDDEKNEEESTVLLNGENSSENIDSSSSEKDNSIYRHTTNSPAVMATKEPSSHSGFPPEQKVETEESEDDIYVKTTSNLKVHSNENSSVDEPTKEVQQSLSNKEFKSQPKQQSSPLENFSEKEADLSEVYFRPSTVSVKSEPSKHSKQSKLSFSRKNKVIEDSQSDESSSEPIPITFKQKSSMMNKVLPKRTRENSGPNRGHCKDKDVLPSKRASTETKTTPEETPSDQSSPESEKDTEASTYLYLNETKVYSSRSESSSPEYDGDYEWDEMYERHPQKIISPHEYSSSDSEDSSCSSRTQLQPTNHERSNVSEKEQAITKTVSPSEEKRYSEIVTYQLEHTTTSEELTNKENEVGNRVSVCQQTNEIKESTPISSTEESSGDQSDELNKKFDSIVIKEPRSFGHGYLYEEENTKNDNESSQAPYYEYNNIYSKNVQVPNNQDMFSQPSDESKNRYYENNNQGTEYDQEIVALQLEKDNNKPRDFENDKPQNQAGPSNHQTPSNVGSKYLMDKDKCKPAKCEPACDDNNESNKSLQSKTYQRESKNDSLKDMHINNTKGCPTSLKSQVSESSHQDKITSAKVQETPEQNSNNSNDFEQQKSQRRESKPKMQKDNFKTLCFRNKYTNTKKTECVCKECKFPSNFSNSYEKDAARECIKGKMTRSGNTETAQQTSYESRSNISQTSATALYRMNKKTEEQSTDKTTHFGYQRVSSNNSTNEGIHRRNAITDIGKPVEELKTQSCNSKHDKNVPKQRSLKSKAQEKVPKQCIRVPVHIETPENFQHSKHAFKQERNRPIKEQSYSGNQQQNQNDSRSKQTSFRRTHHSKSSTSSSYSKQKSQTEVIHVPAHKEVGNDQSVVEKKSRSQCILDYLKLYHPDESTSEESHEIHDDVDITRPKKVYVKHKHEDKANANVTRGKEIPPESTSRNNVIETQKSVVENDVERMKVGNFREGKPKHGDRNTERKTDENKSTKSQIVKLNVYISKDDAKSQQKSKEFQDERRHERNNHLGTVTMQKMKIKPNLNDSKNVAEPISMKKKYLNVDPLEKGLDEISDLTHLSSGTDYATYKKLSKNVDPNIGLLEPHQQISRKTWQKMRNDLWKRKRFIQKLDYEGNPPLILIGGIDPLKPSDYEIGSQLLVFNSTRDEWNYFDLLPEPRSYHSACFCNGCIYVVGGYSPLTCRLGEMTATSTVFQLDLLTNEWHRVADMNYPRACHGLAVFQNKLYVFGGRDNAGSINFTVEVYFPEKDFWRVITSLPVPLMGMAVACTDHSIFIFGGVTDSNVNAVSTLSSAVYAYNPERDSWQSRASLDSNRAYSAAVFMDQKIWLWGGCITNDSGSVVSTGIISVYSVLTDQWEEDIFIYGAPEKHAVAACLSGSKIFVAGGIMSSVKQASKDVVSHHLEEGKFTNHAPLFKPVAGAVLITLDQLHHQHKDILQPTVSSKTIRKNSHQKRLIHKNVKAYVEYEIALDSESSPTDEETSK